MSSSRVSPIGLGRNRRRRERSGGPPDTQRTFAPTRCLPAQRASAHLYRALAAPLSCSALGALRAGLLQSVGGALELVGRRAVAGPDVLEFLQVALGRGRGPAPVL